MSDGYKLLEQGERLLAENRVDEAIERFRRFLDDYPDDIEGQYQLGIALYEKGELEEALLRFRQSWAISYIHFSNSIPACIASFSVESAFMYSLDSFAALVPAFSPIILTSCLFRTLIVISPA